MRRFKPRSKRTGKYKSKLEADIAKRLGKKATYESEVIAYLLPKRYTPDFVLVSADGLRVYLEVKGFHRFEDQQKMKAVKLCNPELDIRMYFPRDAKVQGSKMTNSQWCKKYGYKCYIGRLPKNLFNE